MDRRNYFTHNFASHNKVMLHTHTQIPLHTHTQYQTRTQLKPLHILIASAKNIFNFNRLTSCCCCCFIFISIYQEKAKRVKIVRRKRPNANGKCRKAAKREEQQQQLGNKPFTLLPGPNGYMYIQYIHVCMYVIYMYVCMLYVCVLHVCVCILIQRPNSSHNGNTSRRPVQGNPIKNGNWLAGAGKESGLCRAERREGSRLGVWGLLLVLVLLLVWGCRIVGLLLQGTGRCAKCS